MRMGAIFEPGNCSIVLAWLSGGIVSKATPKLRNLLVAGTWAVFLLASFIAEVAL